MFHNGTSVDFDFAGVKLSIVVSGVSTMYFPQFLVGMFTTSVVVGAWAYVATGSIWKAFVWGIIAAVLLQVGYFALVLRLVYGRRDTEQETEAPTPDATKQPVVPNNHPLHRDGR